jgi:hypothetical protein
MSGRAAPRGFLSGDFYPNSPFKGGGGGGAVHKTGGCIRPKGGKCGLEGGNGQKTGFKRESSGEASAGKVSRLKTGRVYKGTT